MGRPAWETAKYPGCRSTCSPVDLLRKDTGAPACEEINIIGGPFDFNYAVRASHPHP